MSKQALKRVRKDVGLPVCRDTLPSFAWPGGYPLYYLFKDGGVCCPSCANKNIVEIDAGRNNSHGGWELCGVETNYDDDAMTCDHCHKSIPAAYEECDAVSDRHSVNCFFCHDTVDERTTVRNLNGEGEVCQQCRKKYVCFAYDDQECPNCKTVIPLSTGGECEKCHMKFSV